MTNGEERNIVRDVPVEPDRKKGGVRRKLRNVVLGTAAAGALGAGILGTANVGSSHYDAPPEPVKIERTVSPVNQTAFQPIDCSPETYEGIDKIPNISLGECLARGEDPRTDGPSFADDYYVGMETEGGINYVPMSRELDFSEHHIEVQKYPGYTDLVPVDGPLPDYLSDDAKDALQSQIAEYKKNQKAEFDSKRNAYMSEKVMERASPTKTGSKYLDRPGRGGFRY